MKLMNASVSDVVAKEAKWVIFGTSFLAAQLVDVFLEQNRADHIMCFVDNDSRQWGTVYQIGDREVRIEKPEILETVEGVSLIIASSYVYDIASQLNKISNLKEVDVYAYLFMTYKPEMDLKNFLNETSKLKVAALENVERIRGLRNAFRGKRCFIIGNGPSLRSEDLDLIKNEISFAANQIFFIFDKTEWRPTVYSTINADTLLGYSDQINELNCKYKFLDSKALDYGIRVNNAYYLTHGDYRAGHSFFSENIDQYYYNGGTVTYTAMQIAVYMGIKEIYLLGVDHNFSCEKSKGGQIKLNDVQNHFYLNETDEKKLHNSYTSIDMDYMTNTFVEARKYAETHGVKIVNATRGGKLEIFPRMPLEEIVEC